MDPVVETVSVELHVGLQFVGLNEHDAPIGKPEQLKLTLCVVPDNNVAVAVVKTDPPGFVDPDVGEADIEKSNGGGVEVISTVA